jgi:hypothetical protein
LRGTCAGSKRDGGRCTATVEPPQTYCWWHDPANSERRRRAASKAGRSRGNGELAGLKAQAATLYGEIRSEQIPSYVGAVLVQCINTQARLIELSRRLDETRQLEERLAELEARAKSARWGA